MATLYWTGNAADVKQISTLTVAGTPAGTETLTVTCNGKSVVVTLSTTSAASTSTAATALKEALMASTRLDGTSTYGTYDATSNCGGQQFAEFREFTATVSGAVVTLTANEAGHPFTVTVAESMSSGTLTLATPQAATGKRFWDNAKNWDTGSVPANDDTVVFKDNAVDCCYGLPNGSLEVTMQVWQSYTGKIGLAAINRRDQDPALHYTEYRQRYVRLDDAGTGTNIAHRFGLGAGSGSPLINLKHSTLKCTPVVYATGQPQRPGEYALNICCTSTSSELVVSSGSVDCSSQDGGTSGFANLRSSGTVRAFNAMTANGDMAITGGAITIGGSVALDDVGVYGGAKARFESQTADVDLLYIAGGYVQYASTANIDGLTILSGGELDLTDANGVVTLSSTGTINEGGVLKDPYSRLTGTVTWSHPPNTTYWPRVGSVSFTGIP